MIIPRVIIVIASSLDGRIAFPGGGESHLGSDEDKKILNQNLSMVDATIFGSLIIESILNFSVVNMDFIIH